MWDCSGDDRGGLFQGDRDDAGQDALTAKACAGSEVDVDVGREVPGDHDPVTSGKARVDVASLTAVDPDVVASVDLIRFTCARWVVHLDDHVNHGTVVPCGVLQVGMGQEHPDSQDVAGHCDRQLRSSAG